MEVLWLLSLQNKVKTFVLLDMNCKINSLGVLKSLIVYINDVMERYFINLENTIKLFVCLLKGVGITAIRKLCGPNLYCFSYAGLIYPTHFL